MSKEAINLAQKWQQTDWNTESPMSADFAVSEANDVISALMDALREALAEQPAQQEPVAAECNFVGTKEWGRCSIEHHNLVQSEPHNWPGYQTRLLYTSPQPPQRKPLTDEEIHAIYDEVARQEPYMGAVTRRSIARAIEAAHGIKEKS